jgi:hypothetical protein
MVGSHDYQAACKKHRPTPGADMRLFQLARLSQDNGVMHAAPTEIVVGHLKH